MQEAVDTVTAKLQELTDKYVPSSVPTLSRPLPGGMPSVRGCGAGRSVLILMVAAPMLSERRPKSATGSAERHMAVMCSA